MVSYAQTQIEPLAVLPEDKLQLYINTNAAVIFAFILLLLNLFKKEILRYQKEIELQKNLIEEQSHEVRQSIEYAKKIQEAILPPDSFRLKHLPNSFVMYLPKDIVAGDFYWMDLIGDKVLIAAADCTRHGVPGAMVSVVCHNALNNAINEFKLSVPGQILDKTRELVIETFQKSDRQIKDGMDIGLCAIDKNTQTVEFAGANNGLYVLRNGEILEFKPDKQPIGNFDNPVPFTTTSIKLEPADTIYLYTDGFADQFGGDKGKKYKYKPFKELLIKLADTPIDRQAQLIEKEFNEWKGDLEQIDDVCIIGIKL